MVTVKEVCRLSLVGPKHPLSWAIAATVSKLVLGVVDRCNGLIHLFGHDEVVFHQLGPNQFPTSTMSLGHAILPVSLPGGALHYHAALIQHGEELVFEPGLKVDQEML